MNHPSREELIDYLGGELAASRQSEVDRHVTTCGECGELIASWRDVQSRLRAWTIAERRAAPAGVRRTAARRLLGRAAAALLLVASGFAVARITSPDADQIRAELARQLGSELRNELQLRLASFAAAQSDEQRSYQQALAQAVQELDLRWLANFSGLRQDIETVAVRTQEQFTRLAGAGP